MSSDYNGVANKIKTTVSHKKKKLSTKTLKMTKRVEKDKLNIQGDQDLFEKCNNFFSISIFYSFICW